MMNRHDAERVLDRPQDHTPAEYMQAARALAGLPAAPAGARSGPTATDGGPGLLERLDSLAGRQVVGGIGIAVLASAIVWSIGRQPLAQVRQDAENRIAAATQQVSEANERTADLALQVADLRQQLADVPEAQADFLELKAQYEGYVTDSELYYMEGLEVLDAASDGGMQGVDIWANFYFLTLLADVGALQEEERVAEVRRRVGNLARVAADYFARDELPPDEVLRRAIAAPGQVGGSFGPMPDEG